MKKIQKAAALVLAATLLLTACGSSGDLETQSEQENEITTEFETDPEKLSGKITWWYWDEPGAQLIIDEFHKTYPNIEIEIVPVVNADYVKKVQTAVSSGLDLPDILNAEMDWRGKILSYDIWEDLEAEPYHLETEKLMDYDIPLLKNEAGQICGLDNVICASGMAYKADLAREYFGTDDPEEMKKLLPDWATFAQKGKEVYEQSGGKVRMMTGFQDAGRMIFNQYPDPLVENGKFVNFDKVVKPTLDTLLLLKENDCCDMIDQWTPAWNASFAESSHIFYPAPSWGLSFVIKPNDPEGEGNWRVMEAPGGGYNYGGTMFGISKTSKNKELAWAFLNWSTMTDDGAKAYRDTQGFFVPRKDLYSGDEFDFTGMEDPYFGGQNVNELLYKVIPQGLTTRPNNIYDSSITEVLLLTEKYIEKDDSATAESAAEYFKEELTNKEPELMQ